LAFQQTSGGTVAILATNLYKKFKILNADNICYDSILQSTVFACAGEITYRSKWCPAKGRDSFLIHDSDISHDSSKFSLGGQTLLLTVFRTAHGGREREKQCINECTPPGAAKWSINKLAITTAINSSRFHANSKY